MHLKQVRFPGEQWGAALLCYIAAQLPSPCSFTVEQLTSKPLKKPNQQSKQKKQKKTLQCFNKTAHLNQEL